MSQRNDCATIAPLLPWYAAGTLDLDEGAAIERHLAACASCQTDVALWRGTSTALARSDASIPYDTRAETGWAALVGRIASVPQETTHEERRRPMRALHKRPAPTTTESTAVPAAPPRRSVLPALVAAIVIVALMVGVFAELAHRSGTGPAGSRQTPTTSQPTTTQSSCTAERMGAQIPAGANVAAVAMPPGGDGWAIYDTIGDQSTASQLLRYHNCVWTVYGSPYPVDGQAHPPVTLMDIAFAGPDDGWAVGKNMTNGLLAVFHYTGGAWHELPVQQEGTDWAWTSTTDPGSLKVIDTAHVLVDAVGDVWIVASDSSSQDPVIVERYAHGTWASVLVIRSPVPSGSVALDDASVDAQGDLWLALAGNQQAEFVRYSQGTFTVFRDTDLPGTLASQPLTGSVAIQALAPDDVWATVNSTVLHFTGTRWVNATPPALANVPQPSSGVATSFTNVGVVSPTDLWFFVTPVIPDPIVPPEQPLAWHDANGVWSAASQTPPEVYGIYGLRMETATQGWAIGVRVKATSSTMEASYGSLLYYDAGTWTAIGG